ncbi:MAG: cohesin domain-containing protein [Candidatus Paceibacterota bacterium]
MTKKFKTISSILSIVSIFGFISFAHAATFSLTPVTSEIKIGDKITEEIRIDSAGTSFNAAQATIKFPNDVLNVTAINKEGSSFSFWLEEPTFSNTNGTISFTGGTPYGVSGGAVQVLKIEFQAKSSGNGTLSVTNAAITASDGSGTNILSKTNDAVVVVVPEGVVPKIPETQFLSQPTQIVRIPVVVESLPTKPILKIPLYPDSGWYNLASLFTANWNLPADVSGISTLLNKSPSSVPSGITEGVFDSKTFAELQDGTWYLHVRFQNNIGWGPTANYKINVDTTPPHGFDISVLEGDQSSNPTPTLKFKTSDSLSGIKEYQVRINNEDPIIVPGANFKGIFKLPIQAPGKKKILVKAVDFAENGIEANVNLEILPIISPAITFVPSLVYFEDEQGVVVKGTALPDLNVLLKIQKIVTGGGGGIVASSTVIADSKGNWEITFGNQPLRNGKYVVLAQSQDSRGALSLEVSSTEINVISRPIIQIGSLKLGSTGAIILLLLIVTGGFGGGVWFYRNKQKKLNLRVRFNETEIAKIFGLIQEDVKRVSRALETSTTGDDEYSIKKLQENILKMEEYIKKGIRKINK